MKSYKKWLPLLTLLYSIQGGACETLCKELTFDTLATIDYGQTHSILHSNGRWVEYNPLIRRGKEGQYFAAIMLLHGAITYSLPKPWRSRWQNTSIIVEGFVVGRNAYLGIGVRF